MNHQVQKMLETCGCCSFSQWEPEDHGRAMPRNLERLQPASLRNHREVPCAIDRGWKGCVGEYKITSKGHNVFACRQMDSICFAKISNKGHRNDTWLLPPTHQPKSNERKRKKDSSPKSTQIVPNSINQINPKKNRPFWWNLLEFTGCHTFLATLLLPSTGTNTSCVGCCSSKSMDSPIDLFVWREWKL